MGSCDVKAGSVSILRELDCVGNKRLWKVPSHIFRYPPASLAGFVRGLLPGLMQSWSMSIRLELYLIEQKLAQGGELF